MFTLITVNKDGTRFLQIYPTLEEALREGLWSLESWDFFGFGDDSGATKSITIKQGVYTRGGYWV